MLQIYTGDGKGKTTAAFGLAIRASMAGKRVYIGQFIKDQKYNETKVDQLIDKLTIEQLGQGCFINRKPTKTDQKYAIKALYHIEALIDNYDVIILDELTIALNYNLLPIETLLEFILQYKVKKEIIITGINCPKILYDYADLVTEMICVKHYYKDQHITSRPGFDC